MQHVAYAPSKTVEPAKNWGQPTLSQGASSPEENALPFAAAWTERAVPNFSPEPKYLLTEPWVGYRLALPEKIG
jgi:hypothetical protein